MARFDATHRANLSAAQNDSHAARRAERLEDVLWMTANGECMTGAAQRLGLSHGALDHWTRRYAPEARRVLLDREPLGFTAWRKVS
jgi:hypothetical protein